MTNDKKPTDIAKEIELKIMREIEAYWNGKESVYLTPKLTDLYRCILVSWYARDSELMSGIEKRRGAAWQRLRKESKTDKETEMKYDESEDGQNRIELRYEMKAVEKMISSLRDRLRRMEMEVYHLK